LFIFNVDYVVDNIDQLGKVLWDSIMKTSQRLSKKPAE